MHASAARRVCFVTTSYLRWPGDHRGTFVHAAACALRRQGVAVRVITPHAPGARLRESLDGVDVWRMPYAWPFALERCQTADGGLPEFWRTARVSRLLIVPLFFSLWVGTLAGAYNCQTLHAYWTLSALACRIGGWFHRKPFIATVLGSDIYQAQRGWLRLLSTFALRGARAVTALSASLADGAIPLGVPAESIMVISNGVDRAIFSPSAAPREPLLLFCGSLIPRKGADVLLRAIPPLFAKHPSLRLALIGDGPERQRLVQQAEQAGIGPRVEFLGALPQREAAAWMRKASLFLLPSREEGQGAVALEAIACGTPVIASRVGGIPEYLASDLGRLVSPDDPAALADAADELLRQPALLEAMRSHCARYAAEHFDWDAIARKYIELYDKADR
jgi:glycosyltransferase involved in cell wall biosynthesis